MKKISILISLLVCLLLASAPALGGGFQKSVGQTVYAAANYNCQEPYEPAPIAAEICTWSVNTRLFIRNVDLDNPITVTEINFHDPDGNYLFNILLWPIYGGGAQEIPKKGSKTFTVFHGVVPYWSAVWDGRPSFIVKWTAERPVRPPIISSTHAIMNRSPDGGPNPQIIEGLTTTPGTVLKEDWRDRW